MRNLVLILGDQLHRESKAFDGFDRSQDMVWMAEVEEEATHVWCHKLRIALFFSAMRHFRDDLRNRGFYVHYHELGEDPALDRGKGFADVLKGDCETLKPQALILAAPGDLRVLQNLSASCQEMGLPLEIRPDDHFCCNIQEFKEFASSRKTLVLEHFYRHLRRKHQVLMDSHGRPLGGKWNTDDENRQSFGSGGPGPIPRPVGFPPDAVTSQVLRVVEKRFPDHPGKARGFDLPVTRDEALRLLGDFVENRLAQFGTYQDSMWTAEPFLYHSRLSTSLNLKLLSPWECMDAAVNAYAGGLAPLNSVEGFVRQILGWREYIRGVYWLHMPDYAGLNHLEHDLDIPRFFWDGDTDMECIRQSMRGVLSHAYAHHIQRLMVLGLFSMLIGVNPLKFHQWHMAMYADAVDWVSLPNTLGMSQYGDGGIVGTKPYCATGQYIDRMSNYCKPCPYDPKSSSGFWACPFTTLYWDFLDRHHEKLAGNPRLGFQLQNLSRKRNHKGTMAAIRQEAHKVRSRVYG